MLAAALLLPIVRYDQSSNPKDVSLHFDPLQIIPIDWDACKHNSPVLELEKFFDIADFET